MQHEITPTDAIGVDGGLETDLVDLDGFTLADVGRFGDGALREAVRHILTDSGDRVANFCSSI